MTYTPDYKKTPPPVPPRSTTKPLISVTAQSSTESTQDAYHEGRPSRGGLWAPDSLGRVIYTSTDSLDSAKAVTLAMETAPKRLTSAGSYSSVQTCDKAILVSKAEEYLKTPRSSIGIQVNLPLGFKNWLSWSLPLCKPNGFVSRLKSKNSWQHLDSDSPTQKLHTKAPHIARFCGREDEIADWPWTKD